LTDEQIKELKGQLREQVKDMPPGQKEQALGQIESMSPEALEEMVNQQKAQAGGGAAAGGPQKRIFRMIVDGEVPSKLISENKDAIAVVSKRAVSRGHVLIIPKKPAGDANSIPSGVYNLARTIGKKLGSKMKAKSCEIQSESAFGETVVNVIPVYDKPVSLNSERYEASDSEIDEVWNLLKIVKKPKVERIRVLKKNEEGLKLRRRIP